MESIRGSFSRLKPLARAIVLHWPVLSLFIGAVCAFSWAVWPVLRGDQGEDFGIWVGTQTLLSFPSVSLANTDWIEALQERHLIESGFRLGLIAFISGGMSIWLIIRQLGYPRDWNSVNRLFCKLIIPIVFGGLLVLAWARDKDPSLSQIVLAVLAVSPWCVVFLSFYFSEFDFGLKGASGKFSTAVKNSADLPSAAPHVTTLTPPAPAQGASGQGTQTSNATQFASLLPQAKKILRTLWKYQIESFGEQSVSRWGFTVPTNSPEYMQFSLGVLELAELRLIDLTGNGLIFLTDLGITYCMSRNEEIVGFPEFYSSFRPL